MSLFIARSTAIAARALDGEMIIMSVSDSRLFTLNEIATEIWQAADGRTPLSDIVEHKICANFEVDQETAYADAESLCRDLASEGILLVSEQPIESAAPGQ
jgi:hypothetical protein